MTVRLLGRNASINVRKVLWTLDEIEMPYVFEVWEAAPSGERLIELRSLNPGAKVPILVDEHGPLWESNTICRYLAARAGRHDLLPAAPRARADVERWMDWQATDLNGAWLYAFLALHRNAPGYTDPVAIDHSIAQWNQHIALLDGHLAAAGPFATGESFTLADIVLGLSVHRWLHASIARPRLDHVTAYHERLMTRRHFTSHAHEGLI